MIAIKCWRVLAVMSVYGLVGAAPAQTQPATELRGVQAWRADLRVLAQELPKRHINVQHASVDHAAEKGPDPPIGMYDFLAQPSADKGKGLVDNDRTLVDSARDGDGLPGRRSVDSMLEGFCANESGKHQRYKNPGPEGTKEISRW